jgi:hypothetical protein
VGQPEFDEHLKLPRMRQIKQRVTVHCELGPLARDGVAGYVTQRLQVAGTTPDQVRLTDEALDLVHAASGGVPRLINLLCDRALTHGHSSRTSRIGPDLVRAALTDLRLLDLPAVDLKVNFEEQPMRRSPPRPSSRLVLGKVWSGAHRLRPLAAAALTVLGVTTGVSLAGYWLWLRPLWAAPVTLPTVARPAGKLSALGSLVFRSSPATALAPQVEMQAAAAPTPSDASRRAEQWVIQTGVFTTATRAATVVEQLIAIGYPAFQREQTFTTRGTFKVAFAGPYASRPQAETVLAALRRVPGFEDAHIRELSP